MLNVQSIFRSLDGEANGYGGAGQVSTFIRLRGCNLKCKYCDTSYAQVIDCPNEMRMSVDEIVRKVDGLKVTLTGGEPLFQGGEVSALIAHLIRSGKDVTVETNGSISLLQYGLCYLPRIRSIEHGSVRFVVDYKLPSSYTEEKMVYRENSHVLQEQDVVKFVISDGRDWLRACDVLRCFDFCKAKMVFSPAVKMTPQGPDLRWATQLAEKLIEASPNLPRPVQYSLQLHKILWPGSGEKNER